MNEAAVALAYKHCERITRSRARNFYYGIRLLPPAKRSAMCALYAMARRIDDVGDGATGTATAGDDLDQARLAALGRGPAIARASGQGGRAGSRRRRSRPATPC